ncbi:unnamed protein product [Polarella glacialis]|uniref:Uncharacterized protein n=1 Tax=Polarella glacialis TaxID=89957 RepID=A0A813I8C7_POLGL|nr:unnamed protein product [Polarella glacialis]
MSSRQANLVGKACRPKQANLVGQALDSTSRLLPIVLVSFKFVAVVVAVADVAVADVVVVVVVVFVVVLFQRGAKSSSNKALKSMGQSPPVLASMVLLFLLLLLLLLLNLQSFP